MKKNRKFLLTVLIVSLLVLTLCLLVACNNSSDEEKHDEEAETVDPTEGLLISNSDFKVSSASNGEYTSYPYGAKGWTGASMYSFGKFPIGVISGVISIDESKYNDNKEKWEGIEEDLDTSSLYTTLREKYKPAEDAINNLLMVYMPKASANANDEDKYGPTAYGYSSSSFTLEAGKYYKFSVDVLTLGITGNTSEGVTAAPGARIYLSSSDYVEFKEIKTDGAWVSYTTYIKAHEVTDKALSVLLGLGRASSLDESTGLTAGFVFYANVLLEEVKDDSEKTAAQKFAVAEQDELDTDGATLKTSNLNTPNEKFDFGSETISASSSPSLWSLVTGASSDSSIAAPTAAERYNALIDANKFADNYESYAGTIYVDGGGTGGNIATNPAKTAFSTDEGKNFCKNIIYSDDYPEHHVGTKIYMLSQQLMTAQGIKANTSINISKNAYYAISIDVLTYQVAGAGVTIELTDGPKDLKIKNISKKVRVNSAGEETGPYGSTGEWTTYTIFIQGNQYEDSTYTLTLWFGTDGTDKNNAYQYDKYTSSSSSKATTYHSDGTFSTGWAFFDEFKIARISEAEFNTAYSNYGSTTGEAENTNLAYKLDSTNLFSVDATYPATSDKINAEFNATDVHNESAQKYAGIDIGTKGTPNGFKETMDSEDQDTLPIVDLANMKAGIVKTTGDDAFDFASLGLTNPGQPYDYNDNVLMIYSKDLSFYQYETDDFKILPNKFYRISLWVNTQDIQETSGAYVYLMAKNEYDEYTAKSSFTVVNTQTKDDDGNAVYNWKELTFVIRGSYTEETLCHLKITFGTGTRWTSSTLASGAMFITTVNMDSMTYSEWTNTSTGTYVKSVSFVSATTSSFTNGTFNELDMKESQFADDTGYLSGSEKVGTPESWSLSDSKTDAVAGVLQLTDNGGNDLEDRYKHSHQTTTLLPGTDALFDNLYVGISADATAGYYGAPNLLTLSSKDTNEFTLGYLSNSFTLNTETYYEISIWVKALSAGTYSVYLVCDNEGIVEDYAGEEVGSYFIHTATAEEAWVEYKFYISVGSTSTSARILLQLGIDEEKLLADRVTHDGEGKFESVIDYDANLATPGLVTYTKLTSSGMFLFDNITIHSSTKEAYEPTATEKNYRVIEYLVDSFTPSSTSVTALSTLTDPTYWSGVADGDADIDDTKSGIIYIGGNHLETKELADASDVGYVSILGKDIKADDQTVSTEEAAITIENLSTHLKHFFNDTTVYTDLAVCEAAFATNFGIENNETEIKKKNIECWKQEKATALQRESWIQLSDPITKKDITTKSGNSCLVINNINESAYYYSNSLTLSASTYYKISIWVRTVGIDPEKGAYLYLSCGEDEKSETTISNINTYWYEIVGDEKVYHNDWKLYEYYISVSDDGVSAPKFQIGLGTYYDENDEEQTMVSGYAFFDDFAIEEITAAQFNGAVASDTVCKYEIPESPVEAKTDDEPEADTPDTSFNLETLWWMIPTILLALATLIVIVVFFVRKIKRPKKADDYDNNSIVGVRDNSQQVIDKKHDDYDNYKE